MREVWLFLGGQQEIAGKTYFPCSNHNLQVCETVTGTPIEHVCSFIQSMNVAENRATLTLTFIDGSTEECVFLGWATPVENLP